MKKAFKYYCFSLLFLSFCFLFFGCSNNKFEANFVRFSIGKRQNDYYLDFTIKFDNNTDHDELISESDFYVEINEEKINNIAFWYANEETYFSFPSVESNNSLTLRVRAISNIKNKDYNKFLVKYKDNTLVDDDKVYINDNN